MPNLEIATRCRKIIRGFRSLRGGLLKECGSRWCKGPFTTAEGAVGFRCIAFGVGRVSALDHTFDASWLLGCLPFDIIDGPGELHL